MYACRAMTLCIAASCHEAGDYRIVLCFDKKGSSDSGSSETLFKFMHVGTQFRALLAGTAFDEAKELADIYRNHLVDIEPYSSVSISELLEEFRKPALTYKQRKIAAHIGQKYGMSIADFNNSQMASLLPAEIASLECKAQLILAGFVQGRPRIFQFAYWGVSYCDQYAAIGEGAYLAAPLLQYRNQADYDTMTSTLYKLFEAKKLAEVYDSVGSQTDMFILLPDPQNANSTAQSVILPKGIEFLKRRFLNKGPRPLQPMHDFPQDGLQFIG